MKVGNEPDLKKLKKQKIDVIRFCESARPFRTKKGLRICLAKVGQAGGTRWTVDGRHHPPPCFRASRWNFPAGKHRIGMRWMGIGMPNLGVEILSVPRSNQPAQLADFKVLNATFSHRIRPHPTTHCTHSSVGIITSLLRIHPRKHPFKSTSRRGSPQYAHDGLIQPGVVDCDPKVAILPPYCGLFVMDSMSSWMARQNSKTFPLSDLVVGEEVADKNRRM